MKKLIAVIVIGIPPAWGQQGEDMLAKGMPEVIRGLPSPSQAHRFPCPKETCVQLTYPSDPKTPLPPFAVNRVFTMPSGRSVHVEYKERNCQPDECKAVDAGMWGMDGGVPHFVTTMLRVSIDKVEFPIPKKLYSDITNIRRLSVSEEDGRIILSLVGGGAAGATSVKYILGGVCGLERQVCGEVCSDVWERTTWHNSFNYTEQPQCVSTVQ